MLIAPLPRDASSAEERRLATLQAHALLDSEPESEFDALVSLAAAMLDTVRSRDRGGPSSFRG